MKKKICIGLFGTSGDSTWRNAFIEKYTEAGLDYFNPQVPNWDASCAEREAYHLAHDDMILYPILAGTYGTGSLAESGYAVVQSLSSSQARHLLIYIEPKVDPALRDKSSAMADESERARALVRAHLDELHLPTVHSCQSLDEMLALSLKLAQDS